MTAPTPAVERAADAIDSNGAWSDGLRHLRAREGLTAALTDPDDPDSLARTLFVLDVGTRTGINAEMAVTMWKMAPGAREHWRAVADGLRMMLTGSGS